MLNTFIENSLILFISLLSLSIEAEEEREAPYFPLSLKIMINTWLIIYWGLKLKSGISFIFVI